MKYSIYFNDNSKTIVAPNQYYIGVIMRDEGMALSKSATNWMLIPWHRIKYVEVTDK